MSDNYHLAVKPAHPERQRLQQLMDLAWGQDVEVTPDAFHARDLTKSGFWFRNGQRYFCRSAPDVVKFMIKATRLFKRVEYVKRSDSPASATMRFEPRSPEFASHLSVGLEWDSALYNVLDPVA